MKRIYVIDLTTTFSSEREPGTPYMVTLKGRLALTATSVAADAIVLRGGFSEIVLGVGNGDPKGERELRAGLEHPFYLRVSPDGRIEGVGVAEDMNAFAQNLTKTVVAALQVVRPPSVRALSEWSEDEADITGTYQASYRRIGDDLYEKVKQSYSKLRLRDDLKLRSKHSVTVDSKTTFHLESSGAADRVDLTEKIVAHLSDTVFVSETFLHLELADTDQLTRVAPEDLSGTHMTRLDAPATVPATARPLDAVPETETVDTVVSRLRSLDLSKDEHARRAERERLVGVLSAHPGEAAAAAAELRKSLRSEDARLILGALADSGTEPAQKAMLDLARDPSVDKDVRRSVLTHFTVSEHATPETVEALRKMASDEKLPPEMRSSATLALGSAASGSSGAESSRAIKDLTDSYAAATTDGDRAFALAALGNSGSEDMESTVRAALASPSSVVRSKAVEALRLVRAPWALELISATLHEDPDGRVRRAAVAAIARQEWSEVVARALTDAVRSDPAKVVRMEALRCVSQVLLSWPEARPLLVWAQANDQDPDVRQTAKLGLGMVATNP
jgi:HEAT repeat protein